MNEVFILDHEFSFDNRIHEVTSIAIEHKFDVVNERCVGEFIISGDYRLHEVSINKEDFNFKLPFDSAVRSNINLDSLEVDINDFTYEFNEDILTVHVEYGIRAEQDLIEFADEDDLEEFLNTSKAEVVDLTADVRDEEAEEININDEMEALVITDETECISEEVEEREEAQMAEESEEAKRIDQESIINSINSEESYITYHVHTVTTSDTLETIGNQYNISINELKRLNNIEELSLGLKLIIPDEEN